MARSATVWAAALVLASFSGSGPLLTTAEAMPAPGPQQTQMRPRYYFPRHVKRQIVTNSTAPAAPTTSPSSSSTTSQQVESRQIDLSSILAPFFSNDGSETSEVVSSRTSNSRTTTEIQEIIVTPVPERSESLPGTGNQRPSPVPASPEPVEQPPSSPARGSTGRASDGTSSPASTPRPQQPESEPVETTPESSSSPARNPLGNLPIFASTGVLPPLVVPASSSVSTAPSTTPEENERPVPTPSPSPSPAPSAPAGNLLSSLLGGIVGPTGSSPAPNQPSPTPVQPSPTPETPSEDGQRVGTTGLIPEIIVPASSTPVVVSPEPTPEPSSPAASSFQGPFIVPGSTGGGIPSPIVSPTPSQGLVGGLLSTLLGEPEPTPTQQVGSTGVLPSDPVQPTPAPEVSSSPAPLVVQPSSGGIVVGITTALGTGASPSGAIPTSEAILPSEPLDLPSILSSLVSEVTGVFPTGSAGPTAGPTAPVSPSPVPEPSGIVPPAVSSLISEVSSLLPTIIPDPAASVLPSILTSLLDTPTATGSAPLPPASSIIQSLVSEISSGIFPTGVPTASGDVPTPTATPSVGVTPPIPSETLSIPTSAVSTGPTVPSVSESSTPSGILPSGLPTGSGVSSGPTVLPTSIEPTSIPASESPVPSSATVPTSAIVTPPSSANATISETPTFVIPPSSVVESPVITSTPAPVQSQKPMGSDSATSLVIGTTIIQETTSNVPASSTVIGIPSSLPKMIAPPGGVPSDVPADSFMGQVCFKWQLNYPFVSANDGGKQIFHYLPKAIADGLNISMSDVQNIGLKPLDTTAYQGFITTLALFTIPKDLQGTLAAQIRNPLDAFYHNENGTVNALTNLINTACPLPAGGKLPGDNSSPNQGANPGASPTGGSGDGGALGGDINASRPVNASAAGIATGAIVGAIAYGAAMFFVARRYRNKRIAHSRSSSVPSTGSRMTAGSIPGGAAAWMHGARNGRFTPGSRGSQGSSSTQGRSVRTQQISAPVMAENSLGWN